MFLFYLRKNINNNKQENLELNVLHPVNPLIVTIKTKQLEIVPQTSSIVQGKQICMSGFDKACRNFSNTPREEYQDQRALIRLMEKHREKSTKDFLCNEIEGYLISIKKRLMSTSMHTQL